MQRVLRNSFNAALLAFLSLVVVAISPVGGVASAAPSSSICEESNCYFDISAPMSVQAGEPFTVKVAVKFGYEPPMLVPKSDSCSKSMVTLDVYDDGDYSASYSAKASAGVATFNISVPTESEPGSHFYFMNAYFEEGEPCDVDSESGYAEFTALTLLAGQPLAPCPNDVSCVQATSGGGSAATLFANTGIFTATFIPFSGTDFPGCPGVGPLDPTGVLSFDLDATASKTIVFALNSDLVNKGIGKFNVCWSSLNAFTPLGGPPQVNSGLLPACMKNDAGPCVLFKTSTQHNGALIGVKAPPGDPKGFAY